MHSRRALTGFSVTLLSVGALGLWGCSLVGTDEQPEIIEHLLPVVDVQVLAQQEAHVTFRIFAGGTPCARITRIEAERVSRAYDVEVYGGMPPGIGCVAVALPAIGTWELDLPAPGTFTFRFSRRDRAPLDTTITIQ